MRIYKNKAFNRWAKVEALSDDTLRKTVDELELGLIDADLGGGLVKKRVAQGGRGKRSGVRTLLAYKAGDKAFSSMALPSVKRPM